MLLGNNHQLAIRRERLIQFLMKDKLTCNYKRRIVETQTKCTPIRMDSWGLIQGLRTMSTEKMENSGETIWGISLVVAVNTAY